MISRFASVMALLLRIVAAQRTPLYLLTLLPYPDANGTLQPSWDEGPNISPAVELAVELINSNASILPEYELKLIHDDSGCEIVSRTYVSFVRGVMSERSRPVGIIGPGCSTASVRTSPLNGRDEIALINVHLSGTPLLSNRTKYPNSFGPLGSTNVYVRATLALLRENNWKRIAALFDESRTFFASTFKALEKEIQETESEIAFSSAIYETNFPLKPIRDGLIRIITVFAGPEFTRKIMCLAFHEDMLFPAYQWILFGREILEFTENGDTEFYYEGERYHCSEEIMLTTVLKGHLLVNYNLRQCNGTATTESGLSYDKYLQLYQEKVDLYNRLNKSDVHVTVNIFATLAFDGVWALALALNNSGLNLSDYRHGKPDMTAVLRQHMYQLEFEGVSGPMKFDRDTGFVFRSANIFQVANASEILVAYVGEADVFRNISSALFISDSFNNTTTTVKTPIAAIFSLVTLTLFVLIFAAHVATMVYRSYHSLKASSVRLNHLIYFGCYIFICGTLLYEIYKAVPQISDKAAGSICHSLWAWLFPISCTLIFGTITARTWRLYQIFINYLDPRPVSNLMLSMFVFTLLFFDVVIGSVWTAIDPLYVKVERNSIPSEDGFVTVLERVCTGADYYFYWFGIVLGYKACLLIGMTALSLMTRSIRSKDYTTKSLRVLVYLLGIVCTLGLLLYWILLFQSVDINIDYTVLCVVLNTVIFLCFCLVFVSPLIPLLEKKD